MPNLNRFMGMGNLTADPEMRYTTGGSAVCNLRMAINRKWKDKDEDKEEVTYLTVVVWKKQAESCVEYLKKGSALFVEGRLQSRSWVDDAKVKHSILEVVAERVQFLDGKRNVDSPQGEVKAEEEQF